ncbi:hypothetical protein ACFFOP_37740 [Sinosporangium siamense]
MNLRDTVAYYEELIRGTSPFGAALAWTVILPLGQPVSFPEAASRLIGGGHPVLVESDEEFDEAAHSMDFIAAYLGQAGPATMLVEPSGFSYAGREQVMAWLSHNAQVWHVSWNVTSRRDLDYAAHGQWLARLPEFHHEMLHGTDPGALAEEAALLREAAEAPWPRQRATAMAIVEMRTGARLPEDWFDRPRQVAVVDQPITEQDPPIGLWHHEPDLDARLRSAPEETRRAVLLRLAGSLVERFDLGATPLGHAVRTAHEGMPLDAELWEDMRYAWERLGERWAVRLAAPREEYEHTWPRWVAANGVRHSLRSLGEGANWFDGVTYARFALGDEWPSVKRWIREMICSGSPLQA